ncbi:DUF4347 domain-containing protein [Alkalinema pantanalense CENA528]|uniref:DUF4347 domain-containing protein n=1 Tax=Alkalinema pantanalense TaxID=1620705 RepID=UPI003D7012DC
MDTLQSLSVAGQSLSTVLPQSAYQTSLASPTLGAGSRSLLFIDAGVQDAATLLQGVQPGTEVYQLRSGEDAIAQITQTLLGQQGISSLHIISHGQDGELDFANGTLNLATLPSYVNQIRSWGDALTADADILLYGCNVAQDGAGKAFVNLLAQVTGADVAASDDLTGNSALGGDWDLEFQIGIIDSSLAFSIDTLQSYKAVLPTFFTENFDAVGVSTLPAGWTFSTTGGVTGWTVTNSSSSSGSNSVFAINPSTNSTNFLNSPTINSISAGSQLIFQHRYQTDSSYDGGVLEISINGGTFTDILAAGGSFVQGGYTGPLNGEENSPLGTRQAWWGSLGTFSKVIANLPSAAVGQNIQLRWGFSAGDTFGEEGWFIDDITIALNEAPTGLALTNTITQLAENTAIGSGIKVADISVTDDGVGTNTISLSGADAASFQIQGNALYYIGASPNFEAKNQYDVTVNVDDFSVGSTPDQSQNFTLNITDANDAPTALALTNTVTQLAENSTIGSGIKVADLTITDDALGTNTLSLSGADAASFQIQGNALYYIGTSPNFEAKNQYNVTVNVDDTSVGSTPDQSQNFTLSITDVNEAPTALALTNTVTQLAENSTIGSGIKVADLTITDDALGTNTLSLSGADAASFQIQGNALYYIGTRPNFEAKNQYNVTVNVDDTSVGATPDQSQNFTLNITDVNEAPTALALTNTVTQLATKTTVGSGIKVADITITDDALGTNTLSLSGADAASFQIQGNALYYIGASPNFATKRQYNVTVNVDDASVGTTPDQSQSFTLNITNPGASDIFWRNPSGGNVLWRFDGETVAQANALPTIVDPNWIMKGRGDFNQDGQQDMLWQHKYSGELYLWAMNGTQIQGGQALGVVDSAWSLQGMADFNNDGRINLLWRHRMGDLLLWQMNAAGYSSSVGLGKVSDTNWQVMQITDLNNDGNVEILWRNKQHNWNYAWSMNKTQFASAFSIGDTTADWKLKAITDFNGDGQKDILWQNSTTGEVSLWANFSNQFNYRVKLGQVPTDWQIEFTIQLNSQGSQGLFWKNKNTDEVVIWRTSQFQVIGGNSYARIGNTQWKVRNYSNDYTVDNAV